MSPDLVTKQLAFLRGLAERIERGETTDRDEYVIDAIEDALTEWNSSSEEWRKANTPEG